MGGLNTMSNFSTVYSEYYYYCRISKVEEARRKFICCNSILRDESNGTPLAICLLEDKYKEEKTELYEKFNRIYDDFYSILMSLLMERILTAKKSIFGIFII